MHSYLRAIGFKKTDKKKLEKLLEDIIANPDSMDVALDEDECQVVLLKKDFAPGMGLAMRGTYDEYDHFHMDYYFPYFESDHISTREKVEVIKQSDKDSYQGLCDDIRLGIDLIFYIQDMILLLQSKQRNEKYVDFGGVRLSGLASEGKILLPMKQNPGKSNPRKTFQEKNELLQAAREGDEEAFERLEKENMSNWSILQKRLSKDDILTIVNSYVMPDGIECDKYAILGEIKGYRNYMNQCTMEMVHVLRVECNKIVLDIAVNADDLIGEPMVGRRFRGSIWLQGKLMTKEQKTDNL